MLICENFLLIFLEKWKHRKSVSFNTYATACLAGAGIMDLVLKNKLLIEVNKLQVIDSSSTGDLYLDEILTMIKESKKTHSIHYWISSISGQHHVQRYTLIFKSLEGQRILQFDRGVKAKIFYSFKYNFIQPEVIYSLLEQIQGVFSTDLDPDIDILCLIPLIQLSRLIKVCVSKTYLKTVKYRIEQLLRFGNYDSIYLEMISIIRKACKATISDAYQSII